MLFKLCIDNISTYAQFEFCCLKLFWSFKIDPNMLNCMLNPFPSIRSINQSIKPWSLIILLDRQIIPPMPMLQDVQCMIWWHWWCCCTLFTSQIGGEFVDCCFIIVPFVPPGKLTINTNAPTASKLLPLLARGLWHINCMHKWCVLQCRFIQRGPTGGEIVDCWVAFMFTWLHAS